MPGSPADVVVLTPSEMLFAAMVGVVRCVTDIRDKRANRYNCPLDERWQRNIEGALGECAFAKFSGIFWTGALGNFKADDVGDWQVRTSASASLLLHEGDRDDRRFVFVQGRCPRYTIVGWMWGRDGKQGDWLKDPTGERPAYFVPASALTPFSGPLVRPGVRCPAPSAPGPLVRPGSALPAASAGAHVHQAALGPREPGADDE